MDAAGLSQLTGNTAFDIARCLLLGEHLPSDW